LAHKNTTHGFTLVELSIVIVIVGLVVSGVTTGKSLIRQSQLRSVLTEIDGYKTAINSFKLQYNALPGDMPNAFVFWGTNCAATAAACNGNGNKFIGDGAGAAGWGAEGLRAWRHLGLAKLISGSYTGTYASGAVQIGTDVPASRLKSAGYHYVADMTWGTKHIEIGAIKNGDRPCTNVLSGPEASTLDSKVDDGVPTSGRIRGDIYGYPDMYSGDWSSASCMSGTSYVLANTATNSCRLGFAL
jgi:prepilin-type N-terminal cleavage/methylation domain-containing protein